MIKIGLHDFGQNEIIEDILYMHSFFHQNIHEKKKTCIIEIVRKYPRDFHPRIELTLAPFVLLGLIEYEFE